MPDSNYSRFSPDMEEYEPIEVPGACEIRNHKGEIVQVTTTHSEAWYTIIAEGDPRLRIFQQGMELYHQPWMVMRDG